MAASAGKNVSIAISSRVTSRGEPKFGGKSAQERLRCLIGGQQVPAHVHRHSGVGLHPGEHRAHRVLGYTEGGERPLGMDGSEAGGKVKAIPLPQRHVELVTDAFDHLRTRIRPAGLDVAQVLGRQLRGQRHVEL